MLHMPPVLQALISTSLPWKTSTSFFGIGFEIQIKLGLQGPNDFSKRF